MFAKAFRLFVSSTFQDFGEERRLLQERVFPALEVRCAKAGFGFRAVDMRWGVNVDAQLNQRTAEICLGEVIEAKGYPAPNLLILIGDRYGWVPLPFAIARDEFEAMRAWLAAQDQHEAVSDLDRVYALDENHLVPGGLSAAGADLIGAYTLRSREDDLFELKAPEAWAPVEALLREALQAAARKLHAQGQLRDAEIGKYTLSLTEQEIRKGLEQLAEGDGSAAANSIAWVRTTQTAEPPVQTLAEVVKHALPEGHVLHAPGHADSAGYGEQFVEQITARLIDAIDGQIAEFKARALAPDFALQTERATHATFAAERLRVFVGRASNLAAIAAHIGSEARHPLVLTGISGSGKTALMAQAAAETKGKVVQRFVGASASSADQRNLLISVIEDLAAQGIATKPEQWEDDDNRFVNQLRDLLSALDQPVTIFIDALDQLRAPYRPMWLPPQLHPQVKLIVSVLDDEAFAAERPIAQGLRRSLPAEAFLAIEPLSPEDGADILAGLKREAQRGLSPDQEAYILERFEAAGVSPLYLRIAFAIARRWRSSDDPCARGLAGDVTALIGQFLDELSSVHHHEPLLVRRALGLIAAGREGLSESEAIAVLSRDAEVMATVSSERFGAVTDRLPDSVWVRLKRSLAALLVERGEDGEPLISFFHRQVTEVVRARFYEPEKAALHGALAAYFDPPAEHQDADPPWTRRGFIELPFQLFHAEMRERLDALLIDPAWIDLKVRECAGAREIVDDYLHFAVPSSQLQSLIGRTLRLSSAIISRDPSQVMAQLHARLPSTGPNTVPQNIFTRIHEQAIFLLQPTLIAQKEERDRIEHFAGPVNVLAVLNDRLLAAGAEDGTIRLIDAVSALEVAELPGHSGPITALSVLSAGRLASASTDGTIAIWDLAAGLQLMRLEGHTTKIASITLLPNGKLASIDAYNNLLSWDVSTGEIVSQTKVQLAGQVWSMCPLGNDLIAFGGQFVGVSVISHATGERVAFLPSFEEGSVSCLATLPNGLIIGGQENGIIVTWSGAIKECDWPGSENEWKECSITHRDQVSSLIVLENGRFASGSLDGTIRVWAAETMDELCELEGHTREVMALGIMPNGRLVSGSKDGTIRTWDVNNTTSDATPNRRFKRARDANFSRCIVSLDDKKILCGNESGQMAEYDGSTGVLHSSLLLDRRGPITAVAQFDSKFIAFGTENGLVGVCHRPGLAASHEPETFFESELKASADGYQVGWFDGVKRRGGIWYPREDNDLVGRDYEDNSILAVAALPGHRLVAGCKDGTLRIWNLDRIMSRRLPSDFLIEETTLVGHSDSITGIAVFQGGLIATSSADHSIRIWDIQTNVEVARLVAHAGSVTSLAALPGALFASGSLDKTVRLWSLETFSEVSKELHVPGGVMCMAFLGQGRLVVGLSDNTIRVLDLAGMAEVAAIELDGSARALQAFGVGSVAAIDQFGRLHRLAIKEMERRGTSLALAAPPVEPGGVAATREALANTPPGRVHETLAGDARQPIAALPKRKPRACLWALVILAIVLAAVAAAALNASAIRDLWSARLMQRPFLIGAIHAEAGKPAAFQATNPSIARLASRPDG